MNKNPDFNKGINKILKMIAMSTQDIEDILAFIIERFVVGTLTHENLTSFFNFLAKTSKLEIN